MGWRKTGKQLLSLLSLPPSLTLPVRSAVYDSEDGTSMQSSFLEGLDSYSKRMDMEIERMCNKYYQVGELRVWMDQCSSRSVHNRILADLHACMHP